MTDQDEAQAAEPKAPEPSDSDHTVSEPQEAAAPSMATDDGAKPAVEIKEGEVQVQLKELQATVVNRLDGLMDTFKRKIEKDSFKTEQLERLHNELDQHRKGFLEKARRPLISAVIHLQDDVFKRVEFCKRDDAEPVSAERLLVWMDEVAEDIQLLLSQNGVQAFRNDTETFDPRRQAALVQTPVSDSSLHGKVARSLRPGYEQGDEVIQKERVEVYIPEPQQTSAPTADASVGHSQKTNETEEQ